MSVNDEDRPAPAPALALGADLSKLSVDDLTALADRLRGEIGRVEEARAAKEASRRAADAVFGKRAQ